MSGLASEVRRTLTLAWPLVLGQMTGVAISFVDSVMAGRLGAPSLAAVAIGGAVWAAYLLFSLGVLMALPPAVSQLDGANKVNEVGHVARQGMWVGIGLAIGMVLYLRSADFIMRLVGVDPEIIPVASAYLDAISWGAPGICLFLALRFVSEGLSITKPGMYVGVIGVLVNIPANYVFIYGELGFPAMGAVGCGVASSIVQWVQLLALFSYMYASERYKPAGLFEQFEWPNWQSLWQVLRIGLPIGIAIFVEGSLFVTVALMTGTISATAAAAHQVAINFSSFLFMVPLGISMAITIRVGNAVGRGSLRDARRAGFVGIGMVLVGQVFMAIIMLIAPQWIARIYTDDAAVISLVLQLLFLAAIFQLPDGLQVASAGALRGLKDTRIPMIVTVLAYWGVGMTTGIYLGFRAGMGAPGLWVGLIAGLSVAAVPLFWRFHWLSNPNRHQATEYKGKEA